MRSFECARAFVCLCASGLDELVCIFSVYSAFIRVVVVSLHNNLHVRIYIYFAAIGLRRRRRRRRRFRGAFT